MTSIAATKRAFRAEARRRRSRCAAAADAGASQRLASGFVALLDPPRETIVAGYWPLDTEFDVRALLQDLHRRGQPCALPVVTAPGHPLLFRCWCPETPLEQGSFGILQPRSEAPLIRPDWVLVPCLAFDRDGFRLGYGGGYYDRTLARLRASGHAVQAIAVAFAGQEVGAVPRDGTDQPVNWIVTEDYVFNVGEKSETPIPR